MCKCNGARAQMGLDATLMRLVMAYIREGASGENVLFGLITPWAAFRRVHAWKNLGWHSSSSHVATLNKERGVLDAYIAMLRQIMKGESSDLLSQSAVPRKDQAMDFVLSAVETIRVAGGEVDGESDSEED